MHESISEIVNKAVGDNHDPDSREMCLIEVPDRLLVAVARPYSLGSEGFNRLNLFASSTKILKGGKQVFEFDKELFSDEEKSPVKNLFEFAKEIAEDLGGVSLREQIGIAGIAVDPQVL